MYTKIEWHKLTTQKKTENNIINLYKDGRREKEDEIRGLREPGRDEKIVKAMAKTSFDDSYRKTIESVFAVSDLVDENLIARVVCEHIKNSLGIKDTALGKESIEKVKESVREKARENIRRKKLENNIILERMIKQIL